MSNFNILNSTLHRIREKIYTDEKAVITEFLDQDKNTANCLYVPGDVFSISGNKIKVEGDDPDCGVFFVPMDNPRAAVKVQFFSENSPTKITGIAPKTGYLYNRVEIRTRYTGLAIKYLRKPKVITSDLVLEAA